MVDEIIKALSWFDIGRYDSFVKKLSYEQWIYVLWQRSEFWEYEREIKDGDPNDARYLNTLRYKEQLNVDYDVFVDGIVSGDLLDLNKLTKKNDEYKSHLDDYRISVIPINASYLQFLAAQHSVDGMSSHEYMDKINENDPRYINFENRHVIDYEIKQSDLDDEFFVSIDLGAKDDVILKDLRRIIAAERKKRDVKISKYLTDSDLKKFVNLRLLHYIDVMIFCRYMSLDINNTLLARVLYPDEYEANPIERVRKTMPELARSVMNERLLKSSEFKYSSR